MRKSTFKKFYVMVAAMLFSIGAFAQFPQAGVTMLPYAGATPDMEISLILDVLATCPDSALLGADSVMLHSGVTIDGSGWKAEVPFDGTGANGQQPKLIPFSTGAQVGSLTIPNPTVYDNVTVVMWPDWTCPAGALLDADSVMMHSGLTINGDAWQKVVDFDKTGANGQSAKMTKIEYQGKTGWMLNYIPAEFYGVEEGEVVTAINCVFNNGSWDAEGKDTQHDGECTDFRLQIGDGVPYKYSINFVPNDYYPIEEGQTIEAINCVYNNGTWDAEGKAHVEESEECTDFLVPMESTGIFNNHEIATFNLYPNPVGDVLNISEVDNVKRIEIYDISGKMVYARDVDTQTISINTSELIQGIYIVSLHTEKSIQTAKFFKD